MQSLNLRPRLLEAENFTPLRRTPWGGEAIARMKGLGAGRLLVESWEHSSEPAFRRGLEGGGLLLCGLFAADPEAWLGKAASICASLLVKILDARDDLSLQIHP